MLIDKDAWTWWYDNPRRKTNMSSWGDFLKKIYTFSTVEDFWSLWNNVKGANELNAGMLAVPFLPGTMNSWFQEVIITSSKKESSQSGRTLRCVSLLRLLFLI